MTEPSTRDGVRRRALAELAAVLLTGVAHIASMTFWRITGPSIAVISLGWLAYVIHRARREPGSLAAWGLRLDGLGAASIAPTAFAAAAALAIASAGALRGTLVLHVHLVPLLLLYPLWGVVQQFVVHAMATRNLDLLLGRRWWLVTPISAALFGLVHVNDPVLMAATSALGLAFTPMYLRSRNVLPLGVYHGWLGALFYFWALGQDPWTQIAP